MDDDDSLDMNILELPITKHGKQPPMVVYTIRSKAEVLSDIAYVIGLSDPNPWTDEKPTGQVIE